MKINFTELLLKNLKPKEKRFEIRDVSGLGLWVYPSGGKTWVFTREHQGKKVRMLLGKYPAMSLAEARKEFYRLKELPADEPLKPVEPVAVPEVLTVRALAKLYYEKHAKPKKATGEIDRQYLDREVVPLWGERAASEITRADVRALLETLVDHPTSANRLFAVIRKMYNWAIEHELVDVSPCLRVKMPHKETSRDRVLSDEEIKAFWHTPIPYDEHFRIGNIFKLILVTAQRPGEVAGMEWSEINGIWWTIPASRAKNGLAHRVYLTPLALELIGPRGTGAVFASPLTGKPIEVNLLSKKTRAVFGEKDESGKELIKDFRPHDLRRTAATGMASLGVAREVIGKILNHAESGVTAIYDRYGQDKEKQQAAELWEKKIRKVVG